MIPSRFVAVISAATIPFLAACGSASSSNDAAPADISSTAATTSPSSLAIGTTPAAAPKSDIQAAVDKVTTALDKLGIKHTAPNRSEAALGAKASFELTINGYDAGINVFADADSLRSWQEASDSLGGVDVSFDTSALSLNSSEGISNSVEIAPKIAAELGGTAHGI